MAEWHLAQASVPGGVAAVATGVEEEGVFDVAAWV